MVLGESSPRRDRWVTQQQLRKRGSKINSSGISGINLRYVIESCCMRRFSNMHSMTFHAKSQLRGWYVSNTHALLAQGEIPTAGSQGILGG
jgi:hypothetical protein